jgi:large subunit ribosomal protein L22
MKIQVRLNNYRRSARKVREISSVLKGLDVTDALNQLEVMQKGSAYDVKNLLVSAIASAENDFNLNKKDLILGEIMVQEGKTLKRWRARAYGRANQILKRTCHILLTVEEKALVVEKGDKVEKVEKNVKKTIKKGVKKTSKKITKTVKKDDKKDNKKKVVKK